MATARVSYAEANTAVPGAKQRLLYIESGENKVGICTCPDEGSRYIVVSKYEHEELQSAIRGEDGGRTVEVDVEKVEPVLRARGKELTESEQKLYVLVEEVAQKLLGNLDYKVGSFRISWQVAGSAMPYDTTRNTSVNVHFTLENNLK